MIRARDAAAALDRIFVACASREHAAELQAMRAFIAEAQAQDAALASENAWLRDDLQRWSARALQLEHELIAARGRERRATADLAALIGAAQALCRAVDDMAVSAAVAAALAATRAALGGEHTRRAMLELQASTPTATLYAVLRRMFARLQTREALARAAEAWVLAQLQRRTAPFECRVAARAEATDPPPS
jgi:hypothetical protein